MQAATALRRLETLSDLARAGKPVNGLFRLLTCRDSWHEALERIRTNKGAGTPGVDGKVVSEIGKSQIEAVIQQLMEGTYRPTPVRRVYIPKTNGKLRPLGIPTAMDRLVQEVVRSILNRIYEPVFSDHSHGFRGGRSCHTALHSIARNWTATKWLVEVDVKGFFDNIDHSVLLKLLAKRVADERFLSLIGAMLKAGYLEQWRIKETHSGAPQGGIVSPLLANVYLHELDLFMNEQMAAFNRGRTRRVNPDYATIQTAAKQAKLAWVRARAAGKDDEATQWHRIAAERREKQTAIASKDPFDPGFKRLRYVRYADDFLIGVIGSKAEAKEVMGAVESFLASALRLQISPEKSGVRKASKGVLFLGYNVRVYSGEKQVVQSFKGGLRGTRRSTSERVQLSVPYEKISAFATRHRYGSFDLMKSARRPELLRCDNAEIVVTYNAELRGFANYYALAWDVKRKLSRLEFLWRGSLFRSLANKHRVSVMTVMRRLRVAPGRYAVRSGEGDTEHVDRVWRLAELIRKPLSYEGVDHLSQAAKTRFTRSGLDARRARIGPCGECGAKVGPFHWHHVNPMRTSPYRGSAWQLTVSARRRKVRMLCEPCHGLLHKGMLGDNLVRKMRTESRVL